VALLNINKTENHFHGEPPSLLVNAAEANMSDNSINVPALPERTGVELFKIVLNQFLAFIGTIMIVYITYLFGLSGKPVKLNCYLPDKQVIKVNKSLNNTPSTQLKQNTVTEKNL
jgi:hypothetical protein